MKPRPLRQRYGPGIVIGKDGVARIATVPVDAPGRRRVKVTPEMVAAAFGPDGKRRR
jgi:hypothetical protein